MSSPCKHRLGHSTSWRALFAPASPTRACPLFQFQQTPLVSCFAKCGMLVPIVMTHYTCLSSLVSGVRHHVTRPSPREMACWAFLACSAMVPVTIFKYRMVAQTGCIHTQNTLSRTNHGANDDLAIKDMHTTMLPHAYMGLKPPQSTARQP